MDDKDLNRIRLIVKEEVGASELRVIGEVGKFIEDRLIPLIEEKADKSDVDRIERKLDMVNGRTLEHDHRLDTLESLPTIAHELKPKKRK